MMKTKTVQYWTELFVFRIHHYLKAREKKERRKRNPHNISRKSLEKILVILFLWWNDSHIEQFFKALYLNWFRVLFECFHSADCIFLVYQLNARRSLLLSRLLEQQCVSQWLLIVCMHLICRGFSLSFRKNVTWFHVSHVLVLWKFQQQNIIIAISKYKNGCFHTKKHTRRL